MPHNIYHDKLMFIRNTSILYMEIPILTLSIIINRQQDLKKISPGLEREIKTERQEVEKIKTMV